MYITEVPNRGSSPTILLRESYREAGKVKNRTLANLTSWPQPKIEALRAALKGGTVVSKDQAVEVERSLPHGHVAAVLGVMKRLGLERILDSKRSRQRSLSMALIGCRVLAPASKLSTLRMLGRDGPLSSLAMALGLETIAQNELYESLDWLLGQKPRIEKTLARKHLHENDLIFYDVTSAYFEGSSCPLARHGYSRDNQKAKPQIVIGLICDFEGFPVACEVFEGNTADPKTLATQLDRVRKSFGLRRVVFVGDRGLITSRRIESELRPVEGLEWITCLRAPQIRKLAETKGIQLSLFDEKDLAEFVHPDYPGERLVACRNPFLAEERDRKRKLLLETAEKALEKVRTAVNRAKRPLRGADAIGVRVGRVLARSKVSKHFTVEIKDDSFVFRRDEAKIRAEAALDGIYVIRTSLVNEADMTADQAVEVYKRLSVVERAFRCLKAEDLRPVYHWTADRVRAHVLLCVLAYYVECHMRRALAPILFEDHNRPGAGSRRDSPVAPAQTSKDAEAKARTKLTEDGLSVHSFRDLIAALSAMSKNWLRLPIEGELIVRTSKPTRLQARAFKLLEVSPDAF